MVPRASKHRVGFTSRKDWSLKMTRPTTAATIVMYGSLLNMQEAST